MAVGKYALMRAQGQTVDEWLFLYGFDCLQPQFDRGSFEAAINGPLGKSIDEIRKQYLGAAHAPKTESPKRKGGARRRYDREKIKAEVFPYI